MSAFCPNCLRLLSETIDVAGRPDSCPSCGHVGLGIPLESAPMLSGEPNGAFPRDRTVSRFAPGSTTDDHGAMAVDSAMPCEVIPGYEILSELGRGGMGVVYKARQTKLNRLVALKMILAGGHAGPDQLHRFRTEAEAIARLQHPNIVVIYEVGEYGGQPFFSLELCPGGSLDRKLGTPWAPRLAAALVETLARAMHAAHSAQVIHRDLKPANVLLAEDGTPKITDFGLARKLDEGGHTSSGAIMGTPSYMAPEQATGCREVGAACDVYALGAILYELLTGRPPFRAVKPLDTLLQVVGDDPVPPSRLQSKTPRDLETIALKCLHKDLARRYGSAEELADDLRRFQAGESIRARPGSSWERAVKWARRRPTAAALLAVSVLALLTGLVGGVVFARLLQEQRDAALHEKAEADQQRQAAQDERRKQQREAALLILARGSALCEQGEVNHGMVWLARGLERAPAEDLDLQRLLRVQLAAWAPHVFGVRLEQMHPGGSTVAVGFHPDGHGFFSAGGQKVCFWNAEDGQKRWIWDAKPGPVHAAALSPDGQTLAVGCADAVCLLDTQSGNPCGQPLSHPGIVHAVVFGDGGKQLWTGSEDGKVRCWDLPAGQVRPPTLDYGSPVHVLALGPDDRLLLAGTHAVSPVVPSAKPQLWSLPEGKPFRSLPVSGVYSAAFSPDRRLAALGHSGNLGVQLWDVQSGERVAGPLLNRTGGTRRVHGLTFSPDGQVLISAGTDYLASFWRVPGGKRLRNPLVHPGWVQAIARSLDGQAFLTATGRSLRLCRLPEPPVPVERRLREAADAEQMAFDQDGRLVALSGGPGVRVYRVDTGEQVGPVHKPPGSDALALSADGRRVAAGSRVGKAYVWDVGEDRPPLELVGHEGEVPAVAFSRDGKRVATGAADRRARVWDGLTGQPIFTTEPHTAWVYSVAFHPDGNRLLTGTGSFRTFQWDLIGEKVLGPAVNHSGAILLLGYSPDGNFYAVASFGVSAVQVFETATDRRVSPWLVHPDNCKAVVFSADNRRLLTGCGDGQARLWDVATGLQIGPALPNEGRCEAVAFDADGRTILTAGDHNPAVRRWELPGELTGSPEVIGAWAESLTGMNLDDGGAVHCLCGGDWVRRRQQLDELGESPRVERRP